MKPDDIAAIASEIMMNEGVKVWPHERRELERLITGRAASRDRFIQKMNSPAFEWKKPSPRR